MRQEMTQLQEKVETEFEKQKSQLDEVFRNFSTRIETKQGVDDVFKETVVEHLRLARDEGARITATAIAEAEDMEKESAPKVGIGELSRAITEITQQTSQAAILKTLVNHAAQFTPRGAFFIIKNEHFVGWRVFGKENNLDEQTVREVFFPVATSTILGEAVRSLSPVESSYGTYAGDSIYLNKLEFGHPDKMFAVPLVARGRGVAVLYADYGTEGESVNIEALEVLVRIAGLTVELLAASQGAKPTKDAEQPRSSSAAEKEPTPAAHQFDDQTVSDPTEETYRPPTEEPKKIGDFNPSKFESEDKNEYQPSYETDGFSFQQNVNQDAAPLSSAAESFSYKEKFDEHPAVETPEWNQPQETPEFDEKPSWNQPQEISDRYTPSYTDDAATQDFPHSYQNPVAENDYSVQTPIAENDYSAPLSNDYQSVANDYNFKETPSPFESPSFEEKEIPLPVKEDSFDSYKTDEKMQSSFNEPAANVEQAVSTAPVKTRFNDRNVDLPIEVSEEERRLHNDARRFARLLVSEIKLYNEQKVKEGREANDLYERLREAIDRSREMYDKRVQPPVAAKFDYFHYELVNTLAEGDDNKLGSIYPGATV